jgi:nicotinate phosphoribosyltransferase
LFATKAARVVAAAAGRPVADFALRRAAEPYVVARSAAIAGCASTSFVGAARRYGLTLSGTVPHALIQAFATEEGAFQAIAASLQRYSLLLDTYDVDRSIEIAVAVAQSARQHWGHELTAVRLDSGDLDGNSRHVRRVLDRAGLDGVRIVASGDLDEFAIADLVRAAAPIDGFGVGTSIGVGAGSVERRIAGGALGVVYKLVWYDEDPTRTGEEPRIKLAGAKSTWPGQKQVVRLGDYAGDHIQRADEPLPAAGVPLLTPVVRGGEVIADALPSLGEIRQRAATSLAALPERYRALESPDVYPVRWSAGLEALRRQASAAGWQKTKRTGASA